MADVPILATRTLTDRRSTKVPKRGARFGIGCLLTLIILRLICPSSVNGSNEEEETAIISIVLNEENKGEFIVKMTASRDFLIQVSDLKNMGFVNPHGTLRVFDGKSYLSLRSMDGVVSSYHDDRLLLDITAKPELLKGIVVDFTTARQPDVVYPQNNSVFFNYGFTHNAATALRFESLSATQQLGVRAGQYLLLSDSAFITGNNETSLTRLMTSITRDNRSTMTRWVMGDLYASSGVLGSTVQLGGMGYTKNYEIDPYFVRQSTFNYAGYAKLPSEVNVFLDGVRIRSEKLSPGGFDLKNILASSGIHDLEIRMKDAFGREEIVKSPYYFADTLLKKGLHEYSYNAGFLREAYGEESNRYGKLAVIASHRYGLTDSATIGLKGEGTRSLVTLGPHITLRLKQYGIIDGAVAISAGDGVNHGRALSVSHSYMGEHINTRLFMSGFSEEYATIGSNASVSSSVERTKYLLAAGIGYGNKTLGSLSFDFTNETKHSGDEQRAFSISYARSLTKELSLTASYRRTVLSDSDHQMSIGLTYYPGKDTTSSSSYRGNRDTHVGTVQVQKNPPMGEGLSYRASVEQRECRGVPATAVNPYIQYNGRYGIYSGEYRGRYEKDRPADETYQVSAAGSIVYVGETIGFSRPVDDSFALIKVGNIPGVRAYHNNKEIGKTDEDGKIVVPHLGSYVDNYLSINDQDIPVNYTLSSVNRHISPSLRSGTMLKFEATKTQAVTGILTVKRGEEATPGEYSEILLKIGNKEVPYLTARGGEFYLENIPPGTYEANVVHNGKRLFFKLTVPETDDMIIDLGVVTVEDTG